MGKIETWKQLEVKKKRNELWSATLTAFLNAELRMCLLSVVKRSSIGGRGCEDDEVGLGLSFALGAIDFASINTVSHFTMEVDLSEASFVFIYLLFWAA